MISPNPNPNPNPNPPVYQHLPDEVMYNIFSFAEWNGQPPRDRNQAQVAGFARVCRTWHAAATRVLYRTVVLRSKSSIRHFLNHTPARLKASVLHLEIHLPASPPFMPSDYQLDPPPAIDEGQDPASLHTHSHTPSPLWANTNTNAPGIVAKHRLLVALAPASAHVLPRLETIVLVVPCPLPSANTDETEDPLRSIGSSIKAWLTLFHRPSGARHIYVHMYRPLDDLPMIPGRTLAPVFELINRYFPNLITLKIGMSHVDPQTPMTYDEVARQLSRPIVNQTLRKISLDFGQDLGPTTVPPDRDAMKRLVRALVFEVVRKTPKNGVRVELELRNMGLNQKIKLRAVKKQSRKLFTITLGTDPVTHTNSYRRFDRGERWRSTLS